MKRLEIPFEGLKPGLYRFEFQCDNDFFHFFEGGEIQEGELVVKVEASPKGSFMELEFSVAGKVKVCCDRCLEDFFYPIDWEGNAYVKVGDEMDTDEETIFVSPGSATVDLAQYVYESVCLSIPPQRYHPNDGVSDCDLEMLNKLAELKPEIEINAPMHALKSIIK
jgi:uncharacterized metal-binding protein YceD (DUF177 family)